MSRPRPECWNILDAMRWADEVGLDHERRSQRLAAVTRVSRIHCCDGPKQSMRAFAAERNISESTLRNLIGVMKDETGFSCDGAFGIEDEQDLGDGPELDSRLSNRETEQFRQMENSDFLRTRTRASGSNSD